MIRRILPVLLLAATPSFAQAPADPASMFPREAEVFVEEDGLQRLALPEEVLRACAADFADLRLFTPEGEEIPYAIHGGRRMTLERRHEGRVTRLDRQRRLPRGRVLGLERSERYRVQAPPEASGHAWMLELETASRDFVRSVRVEAGGERLSAEDALVWRLPDGRERLAVSVGPIEADAVEVLLEGRDGGRLDPRFTWVSRWSGGSVPVFLFGTGRGLGHRSAGGRTVAELDRPPAVVPESLEIRTKTAAFDRPVRVYELDGGTRRELARGSLYRLPGEPRIESTSIPLPPSEGDRLVVVIEDADSPPLQDLAVLLRVQEPSLLFAVDRRESGPSAILRYGGGRATRARYDLQRLLPDRAEGDRAVAALRLSDPAAVSPARLGPLRDNPGFENLPVLGFAMHPGAAVDPRGWRAERPLTLPPTQEGLYRLRLGPEDLARLRPDLGDLRVLDASGAQWPYLLVRGGHEEVEVVPLAPEPGEEPGTSRTRFALPEGPASVDRLLLDSDRRYFDRPAVVYGIEPAIEGEEREPRVVFRGRLVRAAGDLSPVVLELKAARVAALELEVRDGDDAPLRFDHAALRVEVADALILAEAGAYRVLLDNPEAEGPVYELARVGRTVRAVAPTEVEAGALRDNPERDLRARLGAGGGAEKALLWLALIAAVGVLGVTTLRNAGGAA